ncbi:hypothetical protein [Albibacterium sp.]|uniref:hypothetical protein n=1 Tax=Albibacterium sp. TaxID=2952885 RepID=UPI002CDCED87|nr:hypothetical protein [Albibacterium sp.]HUH19558.1 hypothetical protein [Albibacterium sp.]
MKEKDYIRDIAEIHSMMERSSKFLSLSGWAGVLAGIYALSGAYIAYMLFHFNPVQIAYSNPELPANLSKVVILAIIILTLTIGSAILLSSKKANKRGENLWNPTSKHLLISMAVPLISGGILILILISQGLIGLIAPFTLIFYGLALYNAGRYTYGDLKILGLIEIGLGVISSYYVEYGLILWAVGFGIMHIIYGIHLYYKYEK